MHTISRAKSSVSDQTYEPFVPPTLQRSSEQIYKTIESFGLQTDTKMLSFQAHWKSLSLMPPPFDLVVFTTTISRIHSVKRNHVRHDRQCLPVQVSHHSRGVCIVLTIIVLISQCIHQPFSVAFGCIKQTQTFIFLHQADTDSHVLNMQTQAVLI